MDKVNEILEPILDRIAYLNLQDRFAIRALPVLKEDMIEFPRTTPMSAPVTRTKPSGAFAFKESMETVFSKPASDDMFIQTTDIES